MDTIEFRVTVIGIRMDRMEFRIATCYPKGEDSVIGRHWELVRSEEFAVNQNTWLV